MPRRSAASLGIQTPVNVARLRLVPPDWLSPPAKNVFQTLVDSVGPGHFRKSDLPLLGAYCQHVVAHDRAAQELEAGGAVVDGKPSAWSVIVERHVKALVQLSRALRLSPASRMNSRQASRHAAAGARGSVYDLHRLDGE